MKPSERKKLEKLIPKLQKVGRIADHAVLDTKDEETISGLVYDIQKRIEKMLEPKNE